MTKRLFLKLLSLGTFGAFVPVTVPTPAPKTKQYLTTCTWDELIGLRFMWEGKEWVICGKELSNDFMFKGQWVSNYRRNKYWARPVGQRGPLELCCFLRADHPDGTADYSRAYLWENFFYRA